jgi:phosphatidylglycerol:prolipoprotein diacylglycerol transferase
MHPVFIEIGPIRLYSYGVLIALGGILSSLFWFNRRERMGIHREEDLWLFINIILFGGFLGGRLLYLLEYTQPFSREFWETAFSLDRGFSVMGAFVTVIGGVYWFCWRRQIDFLRLFDYVCQAAPFWHFFGRLGCLAAGCCFGRPPKGSLPWAVTFTDPRSLISPELLGRPVHPAQLYEAFGNLLIAALLFVFILPRIESGRLRPGTLCAGYLGSYAILRFLLEFYRGDTVVLPLGLTAAQAFCLGLLVFASVLWASVRRKQCIPS